MGKYAVLYPSIIAWVRSRVALGLMARWKALYLLRGYHKVWSVLQKLRVLANQNPDNEVILPDKTRANGDWSVRELYSVLGQMAGLNGIWLASDRLSLYNLMDAMNKIATNDWGFPYPEPSLIHHLVSATV